ncbi:unnamed protein product [Pleuronectes platessa]|uniref:Uncharacterized protein n=1 Tax=Pleuronectes platessa TaxID=8262 RepID=A0A9N7YM50_PLEPL|nr:unnamed protein product [Pleuronectes platessa]
MDFSNFKLRPSAKSSGRMGPNVPSSRGTRDPRPHAGPNRWLPSILSGQCESGIAAQRQNNVRRSKGQPAVVELNLNNPPADTMKPVGHSVSGWDGPRSAPQIRRSH